MKNIEVKRITHQETKDLILNVHYAHRMPSVSFAFGIFIDGKLEGVCTFGSPASPSLVVGIAGKEYAKNVIELNRLVLRSNEKNMASAFISRCLNLLPKPKIVVSYADSGQNHTGYVYQATNFLFTGTTKPRTDIDTGEKHSRHYEGIKDYSKRKIRTAKHRYVFFVGDKKQKKEMLKALKYPILPYPKKLSTDSI